MAGSSKLWSIHFERNNYCLPVFNLIQFLNIFFFYFLSQREQLIQKQEKRNRTRIYKVTKNYNGQWLPMFSQGLITCIRCPFSDEPRIQLSVDDVISVTRWKCYWYYGKIISSNLNPLPKIKPRGWFPKRCVVEIDNFMSVNCITNDNFKKLI